MDPSTSRPGPGHDADLHANLSSQAFVADSLLAAALMGAVWIASRGVGAGPPPAAPRRLTAPPIDRRRRASSSRS